MRGKTLEFLNLKRTQEEEETITIAMTIAQRGSKRIQEDRGRKRIKNFLRERRKKEERNFLSNFLGERKEKETF